METLYDETEPNSPTQRRVPPVPPIDRRFVPVAELGRGGMGSVYRCHDVDMDRDVAVKIRNDQLASTDDRARFLREARLAGAAAASGDRPGLRDPTSQRWPRAVRDARDRRPDAARSARREAQRRGDVRRSRAADRVLARVHGDRLLPSPRRAPSRSQTEQRHARRIRRGLRARLGRRDRARRAAAPCRNEALCRTRAAPRRSDRGERRVLARHDPHRHPRRGGGRRGARAPRAGGTRHRRGPRSTARKCALARRHDRSLSRGRARSRDAPPARGHGRERCVRERCATRCGRASHGAARSRPRTRARSRSSRRAVGVARDAHRGTRRAAGAGRGSVRTRSRECDPFRDHRGRRSCRSSSRWAFAIRSGSACASLCS